MGYCAKSCTTAFMGLGTPRHTHTHTQIVFLSVLHICVYDPNCLIPLPSAAEALIGPSKKPTNKQKKNKTAMASDSCNPQLTDGYFTSQ